MQISNILFFKKNRVITCPDCKGHGKMDVFSIPETITNEEKLGVKKTEERICPSCNGEGKVKEEYCKQYQMQGGPGMDRFICKKSGICKLFSIETMFVRQAMDRKKTGRHCIGLMR